MAYPEGMIRMVAQVKVEGLGRNKYQFELLIVDESTLEERDAEVHRRATRLAKTNRENGAWPTEGAVLVWYTELDDIERRVNEHDWHLLKGNLK